MSSPEQGGSAPDPELISQCICPDCTKPLLFPTEAIEVDEWHFAVSFCCPNCDWTGAGVFDDEALEKVDMALDKGTREIVSDLDKLAAYNREEEIERFVNALAHNAIVPEDFGPT